jgi:RNA polymerase sigma factor (sigma-70 family)
MAQSALTPLVYCLSRLAGSPASDLSDNQLLDRYRRGGEQAAFALLMQRHGPTVLGVCRRALGNTADADDAFQTTFLTLLTKADSIRRGAALGCWLYGVARRVAARTRDRRSFQPLGCDVATPLGDPVGEVSRRELLAVLDEEIVGLPEKYRAALVLCGLGERTCEQAARELGWPKSTLILRLRHARQRLRQRLARRGFELSAGLLVALLAREAAAARVPAILTLATVRRARCEAAPSPGSPTRPAGQASAGPTRVRWAAVALGLAGALGVAVGAGALRDEPLPQPPPAVAPPVLHADADGLPLPAEALARVGSTRLRHGRSLTHLEYSPDGTLLASSGEGRLRLWEARTGKLVREIAVAGGGQVQVPDGFFSADGKTVVLLDGDVCRWFDVGTGEEVRHFDLKPHVASNSVRRARLAPRGDRVVAVEKDPSKDLVVYDIPSGAERFRKTADRSWSEPLVFSPDGKTVAAAEWESKSGRPRVRLFDTETGREIAKIDRYDYPAALAFSPDGKTLLAHTDAGAIRMWSAADGQLLDSFDEKSRHPGAVLTFDGKSIVLGDGLGYEVSRHPSAAVLTPDGKSIVLGDGLLDAFQIDPATRKELRRFRTFTAVSHFAFTPDGKGMALASSDGSISQWDLATGRRRSASADAGDRPLRFDADGKLVWLAGEELTTVDWQTGREERRVRLPRDGGLESLAVSADGSRIAGTNAAGKLAVWDGTSGQELHALAKANRYWGIRAFSPDGKTLYAAQHEYGIGLSRFSPFRFLDVATGKELAEFKTDLIMTVALVTSPDGRWLAAADDPNHGGSSPVVEVWDLSANRWPGPGQQPADRREPRRLVLPAEAGKATSLAFSPDGNRLAAAAQMWQDRKGSGPVLRGSVLLWDVRTGEKKLSLTGLADGLSVVRFSPDGRLLATGGRDGAVRLWEVATGRERHRFKGHETTVNQLLFTPDGKFLASSSADASTLVWDVEGRHGQRPSATPFSGEEGAALWNGLKDEDAAAAFAAMRRLLARPGPAVELLRQRLRPAPAVSDKTVRDLLRDLDADAFAVREKAVADLVAVADRAAPALRKALAGNLSTEAKRRIERVLEAGPTAPERRQEARAVEVLERLGTPEAREQLASLAGGVKESFLTREARDAVGRLKGR